ncbi:MAG: diguanylate cyclase [Ectothiorhodospiraceae bacterium]|nr:diguanylate cyclase [Ectothiorhodospiraceae bacterium]MCH8506662.1 diguanylate cyclase [Ectothiorhodospiraceae bacterium]
MPKHRSSLTERLERKWPFFRHVWSSHTAPMFLVSQRLDGGLSVDGLNPAMEALLAMDQAVGGGSRSGSLPSALTRALDAAVPECLQQQSSMSLNHSELFSHSPHTWELLLIPVAEPGRNGKRVFCTLSKVAPERRSQEELERLVAERTRELEAANRMLHELAVKDTLTDCYNRRHLTHLAVREFQQALARAQPLSVIMMDIDHFKHVNDHHGHAAGDAAIRQVAVVCQELLREGDLLGRFGGDEFVVVLPSVSEQQAEQVAERLRSRVAALPVYWKQVTLHITLSLGIATLLPDRDSSLDDLFYRADMQLLQAKQRGRNRFLPVAK